MKKINYLLLTIVSLFIGFNVANAKTFTLASDDTCEDCIHKFDYIIGTHVFTDAYIQENDFTTQMLMYAASTLDGSSLDNIKMYSYFGKTKMYDVITFNTFEVPLDTTYEITHLNGVCIDPICKGQKVNVTLKYNDSVTPNKTESINYKETFSEPTAPTKLGYKFVCWTKVNSDECYNFSTPVDEDLELEASWEAYNYKVTFKDIVSGNTKLVECSFTAGNECTYREYEDLFNLAEGYTFNGWSLAESGEKVYSSDSNFNELFGDNTEFTLYSIFNTSNYSISYNLNGGSFTDLQSPTTVYDPSLLEHNISTPSRIGYTFDGWTVTKGDASVSEGKINIVSPSNIEVEANWTPITYNVVYKDINLNGDTACEYDKNCTLDLSLIPVSEGKEIKSITATVGGTSYPLGENVKNLTTVNGDEIEVSVVIDVITYNISYDLVGGIVSTENPTSTVLNKLITLTPPNKTGYTFTGWEASGANAEVTNTSLKLTEAKNVKLTAQWEVNTYNVVYDNKNLNTETCQYDKDCTLNLDLISIPDGKEIESITANVDGKIYSLVETVKNLTSKKEDVTAIVKFKDIEYNISYELSGGIVSTANPTFTTLNKSTTLTVPTKVGYTFAGWDVSEGNATITNTSVTLTEAKNVKLTAIWTAHTYKLDYDGTTYGTCTYDAVCDLKDLDVNPKGKEFANWKYNNEMLGDVVYNLTAENETLEIEPSYNYVTYGITYNYGGGTVSTINTSTYNVDTASISLTKPNKVGYTFRGWSVVSDNSLAKIDEDNLLINGETGNIRVSALYDPVEFNVNYELNGGAGTVEAHKCTYDVCTITDVIPTKVGYDFAGWINSGTGYIYESGSVVRIDTTEDVTLTAKWSNKDRYEIKYHLNGGTFTDESGSDITPNTSYLAGEVPVFTNASKVGYTFNGWLINNTGEPVKTAPNDVTGDIELYASFSPKSYKVTYMISNYLSSESQTVENLEKTYTYDAEYNLEDLSNEFSDKGYTLLGWSVTENGNLYYGNGLDFINLRGGLTNIALYPVVQEKKDDYIIGYYLDGGSFVDTANVAHSYNNGDSLTLPEVTKDGYNLVKWILENGTEVNGTETNINRDVVLIPIWKPVEYAVNYIGEGVNMTAGTYTVADDFIKLPLTTEAGFVSNNTNNLVAWADSEGNIIKVCKDDSNYACATKPETLGDVTFTAHYDNEEFEITYTVEGSDNTGTASLIYGSYLTESLPETVTSTDGVETRVASWSIDNEVIDLNTYRVTSNITLVGILE